MYTGRGDHLETVLLEGSFDVFGDKSEVLATLDNGRPAMIYAPHGRGKAIIVGSFMGAVYHHSRNPNNAKLLTGLARWLAVARPVEVRLSELGVLVWTGVLEGDGGTGRYSTQDTDRGIRPTTRLYEPQNLTPTDSPTVLGRIRARPYAPLGRRLPPVSTEATPSAPVRFLP